MIKNNNIKAVSPKGKETFENEYSWKKLMVIVQGGWVKVESKHKGMKQFKSHFTEQQFNQHKDTINQGKELVIAGWSFKTV